MTKLPQCSLLMMAALMVNAARAASQSIPADTGASSQAPGVGFTLPSIGGSLTYGLSAAELVSSGFFNNSGVQGTTSFSGDVAYISKSRFHPFSAVYAGGFLVPNSGQPNAVFQSLSFSQVLSTQKWDLVVSDSVSYLPESPAVGFSGIPGVGDLGVAPVKTVTGTPGLGILTTYGPRVSNSTSATASRRLTARMSLQATGDYAIQRFIGDNSVLGLNSTSEGGSGGLTYQLSARDTLSANYDYNNFSFSGQPYSFASQGGTVSYSRRWNARLSTSVSGGPQYSSSTSPLQVGSFVTFSGSASASYQARKSTYTAAASRGVNNGSGVLPGAVSDSFNLSAQRRLGRDWALSANLSYSHSTSLPLLNQYAFASNSEAASVQGSRGLGRYFSTFASYSLENQTSSGSGGGFVSANAYNGTYQVFSLGITYSPRNILLGK